jgi:hypothetical protein
MKQKRILIIALLMVGMISLVFTFTDKVELGSNTDNDAVTVRADSPCAHCSGCASPSAGEETDQEGWTADDDLPRLGGDDIENLNE